MAAGLTLGDAGAPNDDASYADTGGAVSLDWFRGKMREFQQAMTAADDAYQIGSAAFVLTGDESIAQLLAEYDTKAAPIRALANTMNEGAAFVNAMGGRMPVLSIPQTLGALPAFVMPAVFITAALGVSAWYTWSRAFAAGVAHAVKAAKEAQQQAIAAGETDTGPAIIQALEREEQKANAILFQMPELFDFGGAVSGLGGLLKLAVVAGLGWLAWRSFGDVMER